MFGAQDGVGVFRLRLNSNRLELIGAHRGAEIVQFGISRDRSKLFYETSNSEGRDEAHWVYDIKSGREIKLESLTKALKSGSDLAYTADGERVAWVPNSGDGQTVSIMDLRTGGVHTYPLPYPTPDRSTFLFALTWSQSEREVLVVRDWFLLRQFWSVDANSGVRRRIQGRSEKVSGFPSEAIHYRRGGVEIGQGSIGYIGVPRPDVLALADEARARITKDDAFVIERPGRPTVTVAQGEKPEPYRAPNGDLEIAACGGLRIGLVTAFDGRYVLYTRNGDYWLYGVDEKRSAPLPSPHLVW